jgi:lipid-binding SYLF domain-containing protein
MVEKLWRAGILTLLVGMIAVAAPRAAWSATAKELQRDGTAALTSLRGSNEVAKKLASGAKGILVFPSILKAGFMFGGQIGEGVLMKKARRPDITTRSRDPTASRLGFRISVMRCSSWTTSR